MENLHINATDYTPEIHLNAKTGILTISGESYHDQTMVIYKPVLEWLQEFLDSTEKEEVILNLKMTYYNTVSSRRFLEMIELLELYEQKRSIKAVVNWYYQKDDVDMLESGREYYDNVNLAFNLLPY
ncbi:MAG: DUF1987 domain-containing protein [Bacteroidetes bacterium]|nr:MAG: DUF1987 domain-containing protein [Bacteroidota bacterium]